MGLSRNKVAVPEGAAGSPPFYGDFRPLSGGRCVPPCPGCAGCAGVAGVEEWSRPSGVPVVRCVQEWCGHAFGFPDRHPAPFGVAGVPCPVPVARPLVGWVGSRAGAWWFENWIVDASRGRPFRGCLLLLISPDSSESGV